MNLFFFLKIRVYLNIIYTIVEVMRCADPGDSEDIAQIQQMFFVELSKYWEFNISIHKNVQEKLFYIFLNWSLLGECSETCIKWTPCKADTLY